MRRLLAIFPLLLPFLPLLWLAGCVTRDREHQIVVSVPDQKLRLYNNGHLQAEYPVSTSKFGLGDRPGSNTTPLGRLEVREKIGDGAPLGAVFKSRRRTGEILRPNAPGRDPVVSRILWLSGRDAGNAHSFGRHIYIHGTPEEWRIGTPASYGCIRMKSLDVMELFASVGQGAEVNIIDVPFIPLRSPSSPAGVPKAVPCRRKARPQSPPKVPCKKSLPAKSGKWAV